jgi:manganese efflux pump family protein
MLAVIALGFVLGMDNFRTSVVLGALKPTWRESLKTSLYFGLWDGVAPLVGMLVGAYVSTKISDTAEMIGAAGLAGYGIYLIVKSIRSPERVDPDMKIARRWLPVPLSLDNVAGGAALGLAGGTIWIAPVLFGVTTAILSFAGHAIGKTVVSFVPFRVRPDLLTGIGVLLMSGLIFRTLDIVL